MMEIFLNDSNSLKVNAYAVYPLPASQYPCHCYHALSPPSHGNNQDPATSGMPIVSSCIPLLTLSTGQLPQGSECFTERRPLDAVCFWSLWQENIGTPLSFLLLCFLSCLSTCLGKKEHFFCCRLTWCLHMRINPPGGRTKAWLPNVLPHLETLCGHMAMA